MVESEVSVKLFDMVKAIGFHRLAAYVDYKRHCRDFVGPKAHWHEDFHRPEELISLWAGRALVIAMIDEEVLDDFDTDRLEDYLNERMEQEFANGRIAPSSFTKAVERLIDDAQADRPIAEQLKQIARTFFNRYIYVSR